MMKSRRMIAILAPALLILTAAGCGASVGTTTSASSATTVPQTTAAADEYDVYSALIQSAYIDATQPAMIVISTVNAAQNTSFGLAASAIKSFWPDLGDDILGDFKAKNESSSALEHTFTLSVPYTLISEQELASIFSTTATGWDKFYAKYPDSKGFLALSRVGFNQAKDTAVLYTEYQSGATAGEGDLVLMKKTDGRWTVEDNSMFWQS
jgi:ABC-type phosphate transport system substrate-binding protein